MADVLRAHDAEIAEDMPCVHCGYNLRGLTPEMSCPECGTPINRSIFGNQLRYADPEWLKKLLFGTTLKLWNIVIGLVIGVGAAIVMMVGLPAVLVILLMLVGAGLGLWATFLITTQEPRVALAEDPISLRKAVRFCAVCAVSGQLLNQVAGLGGGSSLTLIIVGQVLSLAAIVQAFGELVYYRRFARRIPDPKLERSTSIVLWGLPAATALLFLGGFVAALSGAASTFTGGPGTLGGATPSGFGFVGGMIFLCAGGAASLVFGIWYIVLLFSYRKAFQAAIPVARQFAQPGGADWGQSSAPPR